MSPRLIAQHCLRSSNHQSYLQLFSPLIQGALWGWGTLFLAATGTAIRASLYPASHVARNRPSVDPVGTGLMGDISDGKSKSGGDGGEAGGWRKFVKSWTGGVETATV